MRNGPWSPELSDMSPDALAAMCIETRERSQAAFAALGAEDLVTEASAAVSAIN